MIGCAKNRRCFGGSLLFIHQCYAEFAKEVSADGRKKEQGVITPATVRQKEDGRYEQIYEAFLLR